MNTQLEAYKPKRTYQAVTIQTEQDLSKMRRKDKITPILVPMPDIGLIRSISRGILGSISQLPSDVAEISWDQTTLGVCFADISEDLRNCTSLPKGSYDEILLL